MGVVRWVAALVMVLAIGACGSPAVQTDGDGSDGGASEPASDPTAQSTDGGDGGGDGGGGGGGGGAISDPEALADELTPPNATETSRTTAGGVVFVSFESSDSPETLEGFYEDSIARTGLEVFSRTSAEGSYSWIFGVDDDSGAGAVVSVAPGTGGGSVVGIQVGTGE